jgi:hypothetical protein
MPMGNRLQKFIVAFVAGLLAVGSGIALTHVGRAPDRVAAEADDATPTIGEGRNLTREILRSRREHGEAMAEVHPDPSLGARERIVTKEAVAKETTAKEAVAAKEPKDHPGAKEAAKPKSTAVAAVALPRSRPEGASEPATPDPATANATVAAVPPEQPRSFGAMVFSTVSDLSGKAANLTGDTANFVIELPGRLISAGGKLFERPQPTPPDASPQKRQAL